MNKYFSFPTVIFNIILTYYSTELRLIHANFYLHKELSVYSIKALLWVEVQKYLCNRSFLFFSLLTQRVTALQIASIIVK